MKTIKIPEVKPVKLTVKISSDANVGSNISINDEVVKKRKALSTILVLNTIPLKMFMGKLFL